MLLIIFYLQITWDELFSFNGLMLSALLSLVLPRKKIFKLLTGSICQMLMLLVAEGKTFEKVKKVAMQYFKFFPLMVSAQRGLVGKELSQGDRAYFLDTI